MVFPFQQRRRNSKWIPISKRFPIAISGRCLTLRYEGNAPIFLLDSSIDTAQPFKPFIMNPLLSRTEQRVQCRNLKLWSNCMTKLQTNDDDMACGRLWMPTLIDLAHWISLTCSRPLIWWVFPTTYPDMGIVATFFGVRRRMLFLVVVQTNITWQTSNWLVFHSSKVPFLVFSNLLSPSFRTYLTPNHTHLHSPLGKSSVFSLTTHTHTHCVQIS